MFADVPRTPKGDHEANMFPVVYMTKRLMAETWTLKDSSGPPMDASGTPGHPQGSRRQLQGLQAVAPESVSLCTLGKLSDFGGETYLRALTIKASMG